MPSVVHVITTPNFAGAERYVCTVAAETAVRGWQTAVVGGDPERMRAALPPTVRWLRGATALESVRSLVALGPQDVCHAHMTYAEALAVAMRPIHRAPIVSTRHFAAARGATRLGALMAPIIASHLSRQIAVSKFVAQHLERPPDAVIPNAVPTSPCLWRTSNRVVLVLQRLEREKDTATALKAWVESGLAERGWSLRIVGEGSERPTLEALSRRDGAENVSFAGWTPDVAREFAGAGIMLATAPAEPFGLSVVEAMGAGVPVAAAAGGGHLETAGLVQGSAMFAPGDAGQAAIALRGLLDDQARAIASASGRQLVEREFTVAKHVERLLGEYARATRSTREPDRSSRRLSGAADKTLAEKRLRRGRHGRERATDLRQLVVCSLEPWDEIWRRNQFFADILLRRNPDLRILFVEPPADPLFDLASRHAPALPRLRSLTDHGRLRAFRPLKPLPRRAGSAADGLIKGQVLLTARFLGFSQPTLWINDVTYAPLIASTRWPALYDVTDDWLLAPFSPRELERLRHLDALALRCADEVVVCSPALAASRGAERSVSLIPNGVDVEHFRRPRPRPLDLPDSPVAVYVGSLHDARIDVELVVEIAKSLPDVSFVFVGPNSLSAESGQLFGAVPKILLLGPRPYDDVPAYLQHAEVVIVPHRVSAFTESLDPIKAYECLAVDTPTIATPVAGFRELSDVLNVVDRGVFAACLADVLAHRAHRGRTMEPISWDRRAVDFENALVRAATGADQAGRG